MVSLPYRSSTLAVPAALLACAASLLLAALMAPAQAAGTAGSAVSIDAAMLRTPDVSQDKIVFRYDNDLWIAPKTGGTAWPLSSPPGAEQFPRFSPDGSMVAFGANYDGNADIYELPVSGGIPHRLTFQPGGAFMEDYTPDGRVVFGSAFSVPRGSQHLYYAAPDGGMPEALPPFEAMFSSFSDDGQWAAIDPGWIEFQNWNRYQGGTASDVWLVNLKTLESKQVTDWPGTDTIPMFHGDKLYFLSDAGPEHRRNIWVFDMKSGQRRQVTTFKDYETKWPSIGPSDIVMENGGKLWLLDLASEKLSEVKISVPGDRMDVMPQTLDQSSVLMDISISPQAKRVAVAARGDIWTVPAENGYPRQFTRSDSSTERNVSWSPDSKWIAYFSDASGEYELYVASSDGSGEVKQLTKDGKVFRYNPNWSPDSKKISFSDKTGTLYVYLMDSGETVRVDKDPWAGQGMSGDWAKDSNWITYQIADAETSNGVVMLYDLSARKSYQVTTPAYNCGSPCFDKSGDFLYYAVNRNLNPTYPDYGDWGEFTFLNTGGLQATTLRKDVKSPFAPKNDEEEIKPAEPAAAPADGGTPPPAAPPADGAAPAATPPADAAAAPAAPPADAAKPEEKAPENLKIDIDGIEARSFGLPVPPGGYYGLGGGDHKVFYIGNGSLNMFELGDDPKETPLVPGCYGYQMTPDGSKMLVAANGTWYIIPVAPGVPLAKPVNFGGLLATVSPRDEWKEIVTDAWRRYRDYFYDPNMHGVDWKAVLGRSLKMVDYATNRGDVDYIIRQMVSELNSGHTYVYGPPPEPTKFIPIGTLGCDFSWAKDADGNWGYQISKIYHGADWDPDARGPLSQPGVEVVEGDFLLEVNGQKLSEAMTPWKALNGTAGRPTSLKYSKKASADDSAKSVLVTTMGDEGELRLRDWIEENRRYVYEKSGGKVGYVYVRDTSGGGESDFMRQFIGQHFMSGIIVDERWNGGGLSPDPMIQMLSRKVRNFWATRDSVSWRTPSNVAPGAKVMMINENAGSGGDSFPWLWRQYDLGPLVGKRTWGGLIGISGNPELLDGTGVTVPAFGIYEPNGTWAVEGHGVDPDIDVTNTPTVLAERKDAQLDTAIQTALDEIAKNPWTPTPKPTYPNRSGAGIRPEDK